jgi:hypothetical protein
MIRPMGRAVGGTASSRLLRAACVAVLGLALVGVVAFLVGHVGLTRDHAGVDRASARPASDLVRLRWRPDELVPAKSAGRICVSDAAHGRICASFSPGERPSLALTHAVERRGMFIRER